MITKKGFLIDSKNQQADTNFFFSTKCGHIIF